VHPTTRGGGGGGEFQPNTFSLLTRLHCCDPNFINFVVSSVCCGHLHHSCGPRPQPTPGRAWYPDRHVLQEPDPLCCSHGRSNRSSESAPPSPPSTCLCVPCSSPVISVMRSGSGKKVQDVLRVLSASCYSSIGLFNIQNLLP